MNLARHYCWLGSVVLALTAAPGARPQSIAGLAEREGEKVRVAGQQYADVAGVVLDELNRTPLEGATVSILGTRIEAVTDHRGRFVLRGVPSAAVALKTARPGYVSVVERIELSPTVIEFLQVGLRPVEVILDELRVIAGGHHRSTAGSGEVAVRSEHSWKTALDLLREEVPGVEVVRSSGDVAGGASVRIRGVSSFRNNEPAIYLDGVRLNDPAAGPRALHVLDQIPAETVARIRVLRGPSATVPQTYGAADGAILIETRRGT